MQLDKYDYIVMIDKSGSMGTVDCPGNMTRWAYAKEYCESIAREAEKFDDNGIDVVLFSSFPKLYTGVKSDKVVQIFQENSPNGTTDTAAALKLVFDEYNKKKANGTAKPIIVLCITDGVPNSQTDLAHLIINHANTLSSDLETGVSFIQIGRDPEARKFLKSLDDDLERLGAKYDIVDTKNDEEMSKISISDVFIQAVQD